MPRANRFRIPGCCWHITHRCHDRKFLLRFECDRQRWRYWLHQARSRYNLCVLDYIATSNHVHLLVRDEGDDSIARSMQLVAGRTAQEYNRRKGRRGAFWEDRYYATAVSTDHHLFRCLAYIDLNMVRAGVIRHPSQWMVSGFNEIQSPRQRYRVIDESALCELSGARTFPDFQRTHLGWVQELLDAPHQHRQAEWTDSIAVGSSEFVSQVKRSLHSRLKYRHIDQAGNDGYLVKEW